MNLAFRNLKIGTRLALGFGVVLALLIALAVIGLTNMSRMMEQMRVINDVNNKQIALATVMTDQTRTVSINLRNIVLVTEEKEIEEQRRNMQNAREQYDAASDELQQMFNQQAGTTAEEKALMGAIGGLRDAARPLNNEVATLGAQNRNDEALRLLLTRAAPATRAWLDKISELREVEAKLNQQAYLEAKTAYESSRSLMLGSTIAAIALALIAAWIITRGITRPINQAVEVANAIAANRLDNAIAVDSKDETGQLLGALDTMQTNLQGIVQQIQESTDTINTASREIAAGNSDLSQRTEEQASALEETASSMEELTSTVKQNADSSREANQQARVASDVAVKGGQVVAEVVTTMEDITTSSKKIVDIISVIDGIAFQTNILALNAAVEAARAGEQGRGFAVVAGEVRSLAQRSAAAAKEIKGLISDSVTRVENGSRLVEQAGATMNEVVTSVKRVTDLIAEITAASVEQSSGIEQVNTAIVQMDEVTQQNAALVEEAAAAAESLEEQAQGLVRLVSVFRLNNADSSTRVKTAAKPLARAASSQPAVKRVSLTATSSKAKTNAKALPGQDEWEEF